MNVHARARSVGYMWTRVVETNKENTTYTVEQIFTELTFGCTQHICLHSNCADCNVMHTVNMKLQACGGVTGHVVLFCVVRSPCVSSNCAYKIERIEIQACAVPASAPASVQGGNCQTLFSSDFTELVRRQILSFVGALPSRIMPADPHLSMCISTPRHTIPHRGSVACTMARFEIDDDAHTQENGPGCIFEVLPKYSPPHCHYNCAEGGVILLENNSLSVTLSHAVVLDFNCRGTTRRVCLYMHGTNCAHTARVNVLFQNLDVRTPMAAVVYAVGSRGGGHVHRLLSTVNMRNNVPAYDTRSDMQMHTSTIDRLHQTRHRTSHNVSRWPRILHAFANPDDTNIVATKGQRTYMRAAGGAFAEYSWANENMPYHQLYALDMVLRRDVLVCFFDTVRTLCARISQLRICGSTADALQDHLVALHLGYTPAFSVLYTAGIELALTIGALCEAKTKTSTLIRRARKRLARVLKLHNLLAADVAFATIDKSLCEEQDEKNISSLLDFTNAMRTSLVSEVVCECVVDVFHGGSLVCADDTPMFASPIPVNMSLSALNSELRARSLHPGPCYEHNVAHMRSVLTEDMERGLFCDATAAWPRLTRARLWLRETHKASGDTHCAAAIVRDFVAVSVEHHRASTGRPLHGPQERARIAYAQELTRFIDTLCSAL